MTILAATGRSLALLATLVLPCATHALELRHCAATFDELRSLAGDPAFPAKWEEVSMADGKPLVVSIKEHDGSLFLEFVKTHEGLWAEGPAAICAAAPGLEATIARNRIHIGPAAHWLLRHSLGAGARFRLGRLATGQLHIATPGWSGTFAPLRN